MKKKKLVIILCGLMMASAMHANPSSGAAGNIDLSAMESSSSRTSITPFDTASAMEKGLISSTPQTPSTRSVPSRQVQVIGYAGFTALCVVLATCTGLY